MPTTDSAANLFCKLTKFPVMLPCRLPVQVSGVLHDVQQCFTVLQDDCLQLMHDGRFMVYGSEMPCTRNRPTHENVTASLAE